MPGGAYPEHFALEMEVSAQEWTHHFEDFEIQDGLIKPSRSDKPVHPNHQVLYQAFIELQPSSVLEVGCGWGYHLVMARRLVDAEPWGFDVSKEQVSRALSDWPELKGLIRVWDATKPFPMRAELVFSHAVLMHLGESRARTALRNMLKAADRWVLLIENWERRDYKRMLAEIGKHETTWFERGGARGLLVRTASVRPLHQHTTPGSAS